MDKLTDTYTLRGGVQIPCVGFGTWQVPDGETTVRSVVQAVEAGYRHIDTAAIYGNEAGVGEAIRACGVAREELHEVQPVGRRHGPGEGFRQVPASDDCDLFHGCFVSASFIRSVSVTLSSALRAASLSPSSSRSICASSGVAARSKEVCPLRSTASRML